MNISEATPGAPTPPQEEQPIGIYATYVPHDLPYREKFENAIMRLVNNPNQAHEGVRIISEGSSEMPVEGVSVKADAISPQSLPIIGEAELPLPLDDSRRVFTSVIPGVKLTHPGGYFEGGPGLDPDIDTFADDFLLRHPEVTDGASLEAAKAKEIETHLSELREIMQKRQKVIEENAEIEKQLQTMKDNHRLELQVHKKLAEQKRQKREVKEKRRVEREAQTG